MAHSHSHPHPHPHDSQPLLKNKKEGEEECDHCEEEGGCNKNNGNKQALATMISRSKAANLARINIFQAIETGDLPLVHYLCTRASPMSIRTSDADGNTPLHASAKAGHVDLILYFVDQGMPVDLENSNGHTPLMIALSYGQIAATSAIIKLGADVNKKDQLGFSPIIHAAQFGNVFSFHHFVSNATVDINDVDNDGHSVLCWACYSGHRELLEYLLSEHCPTMPHVGTLDGKHRTAMHWAASQNSMDVCSFLATSRCKWCPSPSLSSAPSAPAKEGEEGREGEKEGTCMTGKQMLEVRDDEGKTPADCAKAKGHEALAQALELERSGIRATVPTLLPKKDSEAPYQFLSSFLPFVITLFVGMPYLPWWGVLMAWAVAVVPHMRGMGWANKSRTLVPAGLLCGSLCGMAWSFVYMNQLLHLSSFSMLLLLMFIGGLLYSYYILLHSDPGVISPSDSFYKKVLDTVAAGTEPPAEYCRTCKIIKPPRSKHCRDCNACIDRFDHHCYWIANCVGKKNTRGFYLLLVQCVSLVLVFEYISVSFFMAQMDPEIHTVWEGVGFVAANFPQVFWTDIFFLITLVPLGALGGFHTSLIARDATTYEMMTKFRSSPGGAPKPYSILRILAFLQHGTRIFGSPQSPSETHV